MLRWIADLFHFFGDERQVRRKRHQAGSRIEQLVEETVEATEPKIRLVRGYKKRLVPAVQNARAYAQKVCGTIPGPFEVRESSWGSDPQTTAYFATVEEIQSALRGSAELHEYFAAPGESEGVALMTMVLEEKTVFSSALTGDLMQRDVRRTSVNFAHHRFTSVSSSEEESRNDLQERAYHFLLSCALERIADLEQKEEALEEEHEILHIQLRLEETRQRGLQGLLSYPLPQAHDAKGARILEQLEEELDQVRSEIDEPADYIEHVEQVLTRPEKHLIGQAASPRLNAMGIKVRETDADRGHKIPFAKITLGRHGDRAAILARVFRKDVMG